mgnify:CR=1 FL=1
MSFDLSWFWNWLSGVIDQIRNWFSGIWDTVQQITNTGQGLFSGLSVLASAIWDSIKYFGQRIYEGLKWFFDGLKSLGEGVAKLGEWIWNALANLPNAIQNLGQWIWNGILWIAKTVGEVISMLWNLVAEGIEWVWNNLVSGINTFIDSVNVWWTNTFKLLRQKLKQTIVADVTIYFTWKSMEKSVESGDGWKVLLMPLYAVAGAIGGGIFAEMIDSFVPNPETTTYPLIPTVNIPTISLPRTTPPAIPTPTEPSPVPKPTVGYGLPYDVELEVVGISAEARSGGGRELTEELPSVETEATVGESGSAELSLELSVEAEVT